MNPRLWRRIFVPWNRIPGESGGLGNFFDGDIQARQDLVTTLVITDVQV